MREADQGARRAANGTAQRQTADRSRALGQAKRHSQSRAMLKYFEAPTVGWLGDEGGGGPKIATLAHGMQPALSPPAQAPLYYL